MNPIFSRNNLVEKTAYLNWRINTDDHISNFINIADGYILSSIELAKICIKNNCDKKADILIFPILTNINHGIELYLKALNWTLNELLCNGKSIVGGHNLKQILQTIKANYKAYKGNKNDIFNDLIFELESYINELFDKIKATSKKDKMDFSRYSINSNKDEHFYVLEYGCVEIDLENFINRFEVI